MKITRTPRFTTIRRYAVVMQCDSRIEEKIKQLRLPKRVFGRKLKDNASIQLQHILIGWDIREENELYCHAVKSYGLKEKWINFMSLIDVLRITVEFSHVLEQAAKLFISLKREIKDSELKVALSVLKSNERDILTEIMIASNGAYTQEQAAEMPWILAYDIIAAKTKRYDQNEIESEIQERRMKNGNKRTR